MRRNRTWSSFLCSVLSLLLLARHSDTYPLSVVIQAGERSCFYEVIPVDSSGKRRVEVFVLEGFDLSIWFSIRGAFKQESIGHADTSGPSRLEFEQLIVAQEEMENDPSRFGENFVFEFVAEAGVYEICLDSKKGNMFKSGRKIVEIEVIVPTAVTEDEENTQREQEGLNIAKQVIDRKEWPASIEDISVLATRLLRLRSELDRMDKKQARERRRLVVHSQSEEKAREGMIVGSILETTIFIGTCIFQLIFISRWFNMKRKPSLQTLGSQHWA